jgi:undecaprenyl-diphosphatase
MTPFQAIVLGVVQGVTEFLPISSSAHLILVPRLLGWPDQGLAFDMAANTGTLLAVMLYFWRDLVAVARGIFALPTAGSPAGTRLAWSLALGTIPAGIAGLLLHDFVASGARDGRLIAIELIVFGIVLWWADRGAEQRRALDDLRLSDALLVGCAQALAILPGTSRSGITISAALLLAFTRPAAARFSFLLSVPIGILVAAKDVLDFAHGEAGAVAWLPVALVVAVSAVTGLAVIHGILAWLRTRRLEIFVVYRLLLGAALLVAGVR